MAAYDELGVLAARIRRCRACPLHEGRRHAVPGEGCVPSSLMLIGKAPGAAEDASGRPFVGRSGRYLRDMLVRAGIDEKRIFITSCVKCRPPRNRTPRTREVSICRTLYLDRQIELVKPLAIVLLGETAFRLMLGSDRRSADLRGRVLERDGRQMIAARHPGWSMRFGRRDAGLHEALRLAAGITGN